jgi:hypothetical protein
VSIDPQTPAADPDLAHLFDLLAMLPGPIENRAFWDAVQAFVLREPEPPAGYPTYVYEKMANIWDVIQDPSPQRIAYLAKYLMFFFSGDHPEIWKVLNPVVIPGFGEVDPGRRWATDVCETAWTLYVRYSANDQWRAKWQFHDDWREWLPDEALGKDRPSDPDRR